MSIVAYEGTAAGRHVLGNRIAIQMRIENVEKETGRRRSAGVDRILHDAWILGLLHLWIIVIPWR